MICANQELREEQAQQRASTAAQEFVVRNHPEETGRTAQRIG
jgi:hypothetical protein